MIKYSKTLFVLLFAMVAGVANAQTSGVEDPTQNGINSPYSRYGFGLLSDQGTTANRGMGGIAYGLRNKWINIGNPASYSDVDSITFMLDAGISLQNGNYSAGGVKMNAKNASLDYLAIQFRLLRNVGITAGIVPFSSVGYNFKSKGTLVEGTGEDNVYSYQSFNGDGGVHQTFLGVGVQLFKNFSVGVNASYLYGDIANTVSNTYNLTTVSGRQLRYESKIKTYKVDLGLQYTFNWNKKHALTVGGVYTLGHNINSDAYRYQDKLTYTSSSSGSYYALTTEQTDSITNAFELPQKIGVGFTYVYDKRLTVGMDYSLQSWGNVKYPRFGSDSNNQWNFKNVSRIAVGAEYVQNPIGRNFFHRMRYRVGGYYTNSYVQVKGADLREFGAECGVGIPIMNRYNSRSLLSISAQYVNVSPNVSGLVKENYLRVRIGFTFNEDWFRKMLIQ